MRASEIGRHLIGKLWVSCPATTDPNARLRLTEEGRAALASFVDVASPAPAIEARA